LMEPGRARCKNQSFYTLLFSHLKWGETAKIRCKSMEQNLRCRTLVRCWLCNLANVTFSQCVQLLPL
jgi:hypothetical protein